ncbi:MAG: FAD-binding oxidoreductase [Woeseiaceae bacterium]|nr:FAD-binding oxidoreductase [Woeseiaceae bacterium]
MLDTLDRLLGADNVLKDEASCALYAQDVYTKDLPALAVARPGSTEELSRLVAAVTASGHAVIPRGGGMSYTSGYVPRESGSVIVDMQRMNRIVDVNTEDMYVTVECGCTWKDLHEALRGTGLRTPYWGTLSGIHATVGGGLSQNSIFWGSGRHGTAADSVLSLEVVLADGTVISTGAGAQADGTPFFRHYGPDLTGLFTCDAGALGFKATATLKLIPECEHQQALSFDFAEYGPLIKAMSEIARAGLADESYAFDPRLQAVRMQRESLMSDVKKFTGLLKSAGSVRKAIKDGAKVALAGRSFMKDVAYSLHIGIEERTAAGAQSAAEEVRRICATHGAKEIENSIPKILRANPFTPLNNMVGPNGERWVPVHTIVPHSSAAPLYAEIQALFEEHDALMAEHGIGCGFLLTTIAHNGFAIEPVFFTPDSLNELHRHTVEESVLKKMPCFESNPAASEATATIRKELLEVFRKAGGIHMQIGKSYPYREGLHAESYDLVESIKRAVDPECRVNPGALGLDGSK